MLTPEEEKLKRIRKIYEQTEAETVSPDELVKAIKGVLSVVNNANKTIVAKVVANAKLSNEEIASLKADMGDVERSIRQLRSDSSTDLDASVKSVQRTLQAEIRRVRDLIPDLPPELDLSEMESSIEALQEALTDVRFLITGENVRNSLEVLTGEDRLDRSAIRGLDDYEDVARMAREKSGSFKGWASSIAEITAGTGITIDKTDPRRPAIAVTGGASAADAVSVTPAGSISSTDVQAALEELDADIQALSVGAGISRSVVVTSGNLTVGGAASTDYVVLVAGAHTVTLPSAASNTNRYTVKNNHSAAITVDTTSAQTIDGAASIQIAPEDAVDLISTGSNWSVI